MIIIFRIVYCVCIFCIYECFNLRLNAQDICGVFVDTISGREEPSDDVIELCAGDEHGAFLSFSIEIFFFTESKFKFRASAFGVINGLI